MLEYIELKLPYIAICIDIDSRARESISFMSANLNSRVLTRLFYHSAAVLHLACIQLCVS